MCFLVELGIALQMVHHHSIVIHVDGYHANGWLLPYLPCDFPHRWLLYHSHKPVYLDRVSFGLLLKYHVQHHRPVHTGSDSIRYSLHLVYTLDMLCIERDAHEKKKQWEKNRIKHNDKSYVCYYIEWQEKKNQMDRSIDRSIGQEEKKNGVISNVYYRISSPNMHVGLVFQKSCY